MKGTFLNLGSVIGGEALLRIANFLSLVVIARLYGPVTLGEYAAVLAIATVVTQVADNGLQAATAVTEIHKDPKSIDSTIYGLYTAKLVLAVPAILLLLLIAPYLVPDGRLGVLGGLVVARAVSQQFAQLNLAILKGIDRMKSIGPIQAVHFLFLIAGISLTYLMSLPVHALFGWLLAGQILEAGLSARSLWKYGIRPKRLALRECLSLAKRSTPVGITYSIANLIVRTDVIVLSALSSAAAVGRFAAGHMLLTFVYAVAWMSGSVWLPELVRAASVDTGCRRFVSGWTRMIFAITVPCVVGAMLLAPRFVPKLYGAEFNETGRILAILVLAVPFMITNALHLNRAIALSEASLFLGIYSAAAVATVVLDLSLLRLFGLVGLAEAIVLREVLMFLAFLFFARRDFKASIGQDITSVENA